MLQKQRACQTSYDMHSRRRPQTADAVLLAATSSQRAGHAHMGAEVLYLDAEVLNTVRLVLCSASVAQTV